MKSSRTRSVLDTAFNPAGISSAQVGAPQLPSSIRRIKNEAAALRKTAPTLSQNDALNQVAKNRGFPHYLSAQKASMQLTVQSAIAQQNRPKPGYEVVLTAHWRDSHSRQSGTETQQVTISEPWSNFLTPAERRNVGVLRRFSIRGKDRSKLDAKELFATPTSAIFNLRKAANLLRFLDCTRVLPAPGAKVLPRDEYGAVQIIPALDHPMTWMHPATGGYFISNEPYESRLDSERERQDLWLAQHEYQAVEVLWDGMHNPPYTKLQFIAAGNSPVPLQELAASLNDLSPLPNTGEIG